MATKSLRINGRRVQKLKCVTVGDPATGKTCLLVSYTTHRFPEKYVPTILDNHAVNVKVDGRPVRLDLWDTAGTEEYDRIRRLSFEKADVFVICYSVDNMNSFENVETKWVPEIRSYDENAPIFMLCTKIDLREDREAMAHLREDGGEVTKAQGQAKAEELGIQFVECSALSQKGLKQCFEAIIRFGLLYKRMREKEDDRKCVMF